jgi:hypothetical protein
MARKISILICLGACLVLVGCNPGPSSSSASSSEDEAAVLERKAEHIEGLLARRPLAGNVLDGLIAGLPDRVRLTEADFDSGKVQVKGNAPSNNVLADYISRLDGSPSLTDIALRSSSMKIVKGRESWEFTLGAFALETASAAAPAGLSTAARVEELQKALPARQASADMLREVQRLVLDSGLQMTRFSPGAEVPGEFTVELPVAIEVQGDRTEVARYLRGLAELPHLWVVDRFSLKAVSAEDSRSEVRTAVSAKTYFLR